MFRLAGNVARIEEIRKTYRNEFWKLERRGHLVNLGGPGKTVSKLISRNRV
jgi:hypothetical protein